jgi:TetR/AcrR family transcriptional regulator, regulator of biofilm formation and stress response
MSESRVPQQARGEERRELILRGALAVVGRRGIGAVTHRSVAEEAGVPLGSLTYWFASKDDLLREALRLFVDEETERLRVVGESLTEGMAPEEIAERFAEVLSVNDGAEQIAQFELYLEAARNPALREAAAECFRAYEEVTELALRVAGVADPEQTAAVFVSLADGLGLRRQATGEAPELTAAAVSLFRGLVGVA